MLPMLVGDWNEECMGNSNSKKLCNKFGFGIHWFQISALFLFTILVFDIRICGTQLFVLLSTVLIVLLWILRLVGWIYLALVLVLALLSSSSLSSSLLSLNMPCFRLYRNPGFIISQNFLITSIGVWSTFFSFFSLLLPSPLHLLTNARYSASELILLLSPSISSSLLSPVTLVFFLGRFIKSGNSLHLSSSSLSLSKSLLSVES